MLHFRMGWSGCHCRSGKLARRLRPWAALAGALTLFGPQAGCTSLPRIDPTGQQILVPGGPPPTTFAPPAILGPAPPGAVAQPAPGLPWQPAPGALGQPAALAAGPLAHIAAPASRRITQLPGRATFRNTSGVAVFPCNVVAPVGSEVVMLSAVCGSDGFLRAHERVEWSLAPGGVGQFVALGEKEACDWLFDCHTWPGKVTNTYAIGMTSGRRLLLTRGTPAAVDDVEVLKGQAWLTITSPIEGVSHVTAHAPSAYTWQARQQTATIRWVDAEFALPPATATRAGSSQFLTTTVTRYSNHRPVAGWRVRYEIVDGPPARFLPDGAQVVEVDTDDGGQATAELAQLDPQPGANTVRVEVIRPLNAALGETERLVATSGTTIQTWTAPDLALDITGPSQQTAGGEFSYRIDVKNDSDLTAREVIVALPLAGGVAYAGANPPAEQGAAGLQWRLGDLQGGEGRTIDVGIRGSQAGVFNACASVRSTDGRAAQDCVATTLVAPTLQLAVVGPETADVGDKVEFDITVTNTGGQVERNLTLVNRFPQELRHASGEIPIEFDLGTLQPGQTRQAGVVLEVVEEGRHCNVVEIRRGNSLLASDEACVTVGQAEPAGGGVALRVVKTAKAKTATVGEKVEFTIEIANTGTTPLTGVRVIDRYDDALEASFATKGHESLEYDLAWTFDRLGAGRTMELKVVCNCLQPGRACNRVTVTTAEGERQASEACVEIAEKAAGLSVGITELHEPIAVGGQSGEYVISVANNSDASDTNAIVSVILSQELEPDLENAPPNPRASVKGRKITFAKIAEIRPGDVLRFRVFAKPVRAGDALVRVEVASDSAETVSAEETTTVLPVE